MEQLLSKPNVVYTKADQCQYGLRGESGQPQRKRTGFATNSPEIAKALDALCPGDHQHEVIIGGTKSKKAQIYPEGLREAILAAYARSIGAEVYTITSEQMFLENDRLNSLLAVELMVTVTKENLNRKAMNEQMLHSLSNELSFNECVGVDVVFLPTLGNRGLLNGDDGHRHREDAPVPKIGDLSIERSMKLRKAAAQAFIEADADNALRRAISSGPRPILDYDIGEIVYFYRMGADKKLKFKPGDEEHQKAMDQIKAKYKLGKFQYGSGKFTGKMFVQQEDSSITVNQENYIQEKLFEINLEKQRKKKRYTFCDDKEITQLRHELEHGKINDTFLKLLNCSSQGGYVMIFYDKRMETEDRPHMVSVTSWKSTKLKRKTVNTLSAECQSLVHGIGHIHWHRYLLLELMGTTMESKDWERHLAAIPYVSVVDSRSLYDCINKLVCTYSQVEDKRTAIDIAILKDDLYRSGGSLRWVAGDNMIADPLTKKMNSDFLRCVCNTGYWSLSETGHRTQCTTHDVLLVSLGR
ncbi:unnamed protein product [Durusdinium trenchii]|uniref:Uncharacterized protein n=1 Tax=Durusdinium trenchii TaxID=1381693 RepID=A0ABP0NV13_9DINO